MTEKRIGAKNRESVPPPILLQLNKGEIESVNLVEWLAIDLLVLLENFLKSIKRKTYLKTIQDKVNSLNKKTVTTMNEAIGIGLLSVMKSNQDTFEKEILNHTSDTVRGWGAYIIGNNSDLSIKSSLKEIQILAKDSHFGVREVAWLALRKKISENLVESISILESWSLSKNEYIRRFASESTRPRGVWCKHIEELKKEPELALKILNPLFSDSSKYVRDSVGNWLNDASKTKPNFVKKVCKEWSKKSKTKETEYIVKKALRSLTVK